MSKILDKLADQHEERIINVLYKLEDDVIDAVRKSTGGELVSTRIAIQLQPQLRTIIENNFLNEADLLINSEYNLIAKEVLDTFGKMPIPAKFRNLTQVDLQTINALKYQSFSGFEDVAERFIKVINDEVYQSTIAGRPFADVEKNIRSHINGVYQKSNQREINELVDYINENKYNPSLKSKVEDSITKLRTKYAADRAGENLRKYADVKIFELTNISINETLSRTIITSVTTLLALLSIFIFGGEILKGFSLAMILGVIFGTYSSIYIASPVVLLWQKKFNTQN